MWHYIGLNDNVNNIFWLVLATYVYTMTTLQIKKSKLNLLKALQEEIDVALKNANTSSMPDRKSVKRLKTIKKELNNWVEEMESAN